MGAVVTGTFVLLQERGDKDEKTDKEPWFHGQAVFLQFCGGTYSYGGNPGHHGTGRIPGAYGPVAPGRHSPVGLHGIGATYRIHYLESQNGKQSEVPCRERGREAGENGRKRGWTMTVTVFLVLLTICAAVTSLMTEGIKKFLDGMGTAYASNIVVLFVALTVGCGATAIYYVNCQVPFNALNSVYLALMGVANWLGAMLGYDKVKQAIVQIGEKRRTEG